MRELGPDNVALRRALAAAVETLEQRCMIKGGGYVECTVCCVMWPETETGLGHQETCPIRRAREALK